MEEKDLPTESLIELKPPWNTSATNSGLSPEGEETLNREKQWIDPNSDFDEKLIRNITKRVLIPARIKMTDLMLETGTLEKNNYRSSLWKPLLGRKGMTSGRTLKGDCGQTWSFDVQENIWILWSGPKGERSLLPLERLSEWQSIEAEFKLRSFDRKQNLSADMWVAEPEKKRNVDHNWSLCCILS